MSNPIAMILSSAMLLDWLGAKYSDDHVRDAARRVEQGVADAVRNGISTRDLGGSASTTEFTDGGRPPDQGRQLTAGPSTRADHHVDQGPTVALVHASPASMAPANEAFAELFPTRASGTCSMTAWSPTRTLPAV